MTRCLLPKPGVKRHRRSRLGVASGVFEIVDDYDTNTYRAIYTVKIGARIYVLHCFQKKSTRGIKTPRKEIDLIKRRLKMAQEMERNNERED